MKKRLTYWLLVKLTLIMTLAISCIMSVNAQESQNTAKNRSYTSVRIMVFTALIYSHGSFSYEQTIAPRHSVGLDAFANLYIHPNIQYNFSGRNKYGYDVYYRFRFQEKGLVSYFLQSSFGYYKLGQSNHDESYTSSNYYWGPGIGLSKNVKNSSTIYFDFWFGAQIGHRKYTSYKYLIEDESGTPEPENPYNDGPGVSMRVSIMIGIRL